MSNHIRVIAPSLTLTQSMYSSTITLHVPSGVSQATITASPGTTFIDGSTSKTTSGYITVCSNVLDPTVWTILDAFPYSSYAELASLAGTGIGIRSTMFVKGHVDTKGYISTIGDIVTPSLTQEGNPLATTSNLTSTINGLGTFYLSTGPSNIQSTVAGLGTFYISMAGLQSTTDGLGSTYVSTNSLISSIQSSNYLTQSNIRSTLNGLGLTYISSRSLVSTIDGLSNVYISSNANRSTVAGLVDQETISLVSTVNTLGSSYISSSSLLSTVRDLGSLYISSAQVNDLVGRFSEGISQFLLTNMVNQLGSNRYISTTQLTSTTTGVTLALTSNVQTLGYICSTQLFSAFDQIPYVSSASLRSTVASTYILQTSNLVSTVQGLGSLASNQYISSPSITSSIAGVSNVFSSNLVSTFVGLGGFYISSAEIVSTVQGMGPLYISSTSLVSTTTSYKVLGLQTLVDTAGYISTTGLVSTTTGLLNSNDLFSTVRGLGSIYISTPHLVSTVEGLGPLYISTASLVSTTTAYEVLGLQRLVDTAGYISTTGLVSTTTGLLWSNDLFSTVRGLGSIYISSPHLTSTVEGLGPLYISTASLVSTTLGYSNAGLQRLVDKAGETYISTSGLVENTRILLDSNNLFSTARGLGSIYISTPHLVSTVQGLGSLGLNGYISTASLVSTYLGYTTFERSQLVNMVDNSLGNYVRRTTLVTTTADLRSNFSNIFLSTLDGLGTSKYISLPQLIDGVNRLTPYATSATLTNNLTIPALNNEAAMLQLVKTEAPLYYIEREEHVSTTIGLRSNFSNVFLSTLDGLGTFYISTPDLLTATSNITASIVSPTQFTNTVTGYSNAQRQVLESNVVHAGQIYVSTLSLVSTTTGLRTTFSNSLVSTATGLGTYYISSPHLISTVAGLGNVNGIGNGYVSTASLTSTFTSLSNTHASALIKLFEAGVSPAYISTLDLTSTVAGISNIYITNSNLLSTVQGLGSFYISTPSVTSTITGLEVGQSNVVRTILQSTVGGLGQTYLSTLRIESVIAIAPSPDLSNVVATATYSNTFAMYPNGYIYYNGANTLAATSNFYEESNLSIINIPVKVVRSTIAGTVRTIGYDSNYLYGDGTYLTIDSDHRLKEDIHVLSSSTALEQVTSLQGVYYKKIGNPLPYIGCIAQEVESVFPQVITTHPSVEPKDLKSMKYEFLLAPLVESVKELVNIHSTLKYFVEKNHRNIQ